MKITTKTGWVGFLVALSALNIPDAQAAVNQPTGTTSNPQVIESRIARIVATLKVRENQLSASYPTPDEIALGWGDGGRGGFVNAIGGGGFVNATGGGGFANVNPWSNGWADGGGFINRRF